MSKIISRKLFEELQTQTDKIPCNLQTKKWCQKSYLSSKAISNKPFFSCSQCKHKCELNILLTFMAKLQYDCYKVVEEDFDNYTSYILVPADEYPDLHGWRVVFIGTGDYEIQPYCNEMCDLQILSCTVIPVKDLCDIIGIPVV